MPSTVTDIVVQSDKADGSRVYHSTDRVYDLVKDKDQETINSEVGSSLAAAEEGLAYIVDGDTCTTAVPSKAYAYIKNNTHNLAEGLYRNKSSSSFPTSGGTADGTVFESVSGGGLNDLKNSLGYIESDGTTIWTKGWNSTLPNYQFTANGWVFYQLLSNDTDRGMTVQLDGISVAYQSGGAIAGGLFPVKSGQTLNVVCTASNPRCEFTVYRKIN